MRPYRRRRTKPRPEQSITSPAEQTGDHHDEDTDEVVDLTDGAVLRFSRRSRIARSARRNRG